MELIKDTAKELWIKALTYVLESGVDYQDNDGRTCREVDNLLLTVNDPTGCESLIDFVRSKTKHVYPSKEELVTIIFKKSKVPVYEYTYGKRIFNFGDAIDQVNDYVIPLLKNDASSRRAVIMVYDPVSDSDKDNRSTPSIMYLQFRVRGDDLLMIAHVRSNDLFFGWPANLFQLYSLQKYIADALKLVPSSLSVFSNSAHLFLDNKEEIKEII